jgi:thiamine monophosphate synthase
VHATASKPGYGPLLGDEGLARLVRTLRAESAACGAPAPAVYALGGLGPDNARAAIQAGAHGVAVMGTVMSAPDPGTTISELCRSTTLDVAQLRTTGTGDG